MLLCLNWVVEDMMIVAGKPHSSRWAEIKIQRRGGFHNPTRHLSARWRRMEEP
ncbi:hypothetical protein MANES_05G144201v8 [Manihot esculenta]|uniref:Uncharacterized protein n=1 Tax=Manihot esculenta TaxID=3983 RepID=A0ACB7HQH8_MANES|nr:hypothetical protein MANES_05G144201v8 [Manihot esculenta]